MGPKAIYRPCQVSINLYSQIYHVCGLPVEVRNLIDHETFLGRRHNHEVNILGGFPGLRHPLLRRDKLKKFLGDILPPSVVFVDADAVNDTRRRRLYL